VNFRSRPVFRFQNATKRQWIEELERTVGPVRRQGANDFLNLLSPERQEVVRDSPKTWSQRFTVVPSLPVLEPLTEGWDDDLNGVR
jgi:hypothetical protein